MIYTKDNIFGVYFEAGGKPLVTGDYTEGGYVRVYSQTDKRKTRKMVSEWDPEFVAFMLNEGADWKLSAVQGPPVNNQYTVI